MNGRFEWGPRRNDDLAPLGCRCVPDEVLDDCGTGDAVPAGDEGNLGHDVFAKFENLVAGFPFGWPYVVLVQSLRRMMGTDR